MAAKRPRKPKKPMREGTRFICLAIKELVERSGIPVAEIAKKADDMSKQHIYKIMAEEQEPSLTMCEDLYEACGESFGDWQKGRTKFGANRFVIEQVDMMLKKGGADWSRTVTETVAGLVLRFYERRTLQQKRHDDGLPDQSDTKS